MFIKDYEYCSCSNKSVTTGFEDDFGFWDVCVNCGKRLEDGFHYYNHYDASDHIEYMTADGDIYIDGEDDDE